MAKTKNPKKVKQLYDENGNWVEERTRIKGALRKTFRLSPQMKEVLTEARVEFPPEPKKDGSAGKQIRVRFRCAMCNELFQKKKGKTTLVQVDHIEPVVCLWETEADMLYDGEDGLVRRIMCKKKNLQVLCSTPLKMNDGKPSCHKIKTDEENYIRKRLVPLAKLHGYPFGVLNIVEASKDPNYNSHFNLEYEIDRLKKEFQIYLVEKEKTRLAKEERKRLKELKK